MVLEKVTERGQKNRENIVVVLKKWLPLQCFNKQMIVLQI